MANDISAGRVKQIKNLISERVQRGDFTPEKVVVKGDIPAEQIDASDPRLFALWDEAARIATDSNKCGEYDRLTNALGAPRRTAPIQFRFTMDVPVTIRVDTTVAGNTEEEARTKFQRGNRVSVEQFLRNHMTAAELARLLAQHDRYGYRGSYTIGEPDFGVVDGADENVTAVQGPFSPAVPMVTPHEVWTPPKTGVMIGYPQLEQADRLEAEREAQRERLNAATGAMKEATTRLTATATAAGFPITVTNLATGVTTYGV